MNKVKRVNRVINIRQMNLRRTASEQATRSAGHPVGE